MPGTKIKVLKYQKLKNSQIYVFLGAWNFYKEILKKENFFYVNSGKFITHTHTLPKNNKKMKKNYFWSPHIDPQIATLRSVSNSINSLTRYKKTQKNFLINVFGEWDKHNFRMVEKINLITKRRFKKKKI